MLEASLMNKKEDLIKKKILIIDDASDIRALLKIVLEANEYTVYSTSNGREALSLLHQLTELPDLILLDTQMPTMDGFQFRKQQKLHDRLNKIPVIVTTGDSSLDVFEKMNFPKMVLCKPVNMDTLLKSIADSLSPMSA